MKTLKADKALKDLLLAISNMETESMIDYLNHVKNEIHNISPFRNEPVDCVIWVKCDDIEANDWNPNDVAPPEMKLLLHSIKEDGYTQPIVSWHNSKTYEVVDGYHRNRIGKEYIDINTRLMGYLPITIINEKRSKREDRIAATIRHNRARGKHQVGAMSDIVQELVKKNWSDKKIAKELGMDPDEVLRLKQITGLAEMFSDREFSEAWDA